MTKMPNPYRCRSDTCSDCIFNEECASEVLDHLDRGIWLPIPSELNKYIKSEAGHDE